MDGIMSPRECNGNSNLIDMLMTDYLTHINECYEVTLYTGLTI